jgi:iron complex outermembrane recepter protein
LDVAFRTEQYSDVGLARNPKVALMYKPNSRIKVSASLGTSFRAPSLLQQFDIPQALLEFVPDAATPGAQSLALLRFGGNSLLRPETSTDAALDLTLTPVPGVSLQIGYYEIFYHKRIEYPTPNTTDPLSDRNVLPFVTSGPSSAYISQIVAQSQLLNLTDGRFLPQAATLVIDDRNQNIARQQASGVDLLAKYCRDTGIGRLDTSLDVARLQLKQKTTDETTTVPLSGTLFYPPTWRGRLGAGWSYSHYLGSLFLNYTGGSREVSAPGQQTALAPAKPIASWTTVDGQIGMILNGGTHWGNTKLTFSAQNLLDRRPPLITPGQPGPNGINYDSTNSSPVGRFLNFQLTQAW